MDTILTGYSLYAWIAAEDCSDVRFNDDDLILVGSDMMDIKTLEETVPEIWVLERVAH